jgi:hypothetical protein
VREEEKIYDINEQRVAQKVSCHLFEFLHFTLQHGVESNRDVKHRNNIESGVLEWYFLCLTKFKNLKVGKAF